jgi:hypothetical protein
MRSSLSVLLITIATVLVSSAAAVCTSNSLCQYAQATLTGAQTCDTNFWINQLSATQDDSVKATIYTQFQACTATGASDSAGNRCCEDPCKAYSGTSTCTDNRNCAALPFHSNGGSEAEAVCVRREKLCSLLSVGSGVGDAKNNQCGLYSFCFNRGGVCDYVNPTSGAAAAATLAPGEDVGSKCGALHPMVVAMLALMFVTLVGGIILVGVVVVLNQRKADAEDAEAARLAK